MWNDPEMSQEAFNIVQILKKEAGVSGQVDSLLRATTSGSSTPTNTTTGRDYSYARWEEFHTIDELSGTQTEKEGAGKLNSVDT